MSVFCSNIWIFASECWKYTQRGPDFKVFPGRIPPDPYPASRGYIFAVWSVVRKVTSADNRSIFYHACAKFVTWFASKINHQGSSGLSSNVASSTGIKILQQLWSATQDSRNALNWSRTGKNLFFKFIRPDFWTDLNGCWQRLLFAWQLTQRKFSLCSQGTRPS